MFSAISNRDANDFRDIGGPFGRRPSRNFVPRITTSMQDALDDIDYFRFEGDSDESIMAHLLDVYGETTARAAFAMRGVE